MWRSDNETRNCPERSLAGPLVKKEVFAKYSTLGRTNKRALVPRSATGKPNAFLEEVKYSLSDAN